MSEWHDIKQDDIEIDGAKEEVNLLVTSTDWGNVYAILTFEQINEIYNKLQANYDGR